MGSGWGDQGGCEQRIEVFGKISRKKFFLTEPGLEPTTSGLEIH